MDPRDDERPSDPVEEQDADAKLDEARPVVEREPGHGAGPDPETDEDTASGGAPE